MKSKNLEDLGLSIHTVESKINVPKNADIYLINFMEKKNFF